MTAVRAIAAAAAVVLLGGCAVGPDYRSPLPSAPAQTPFEGSEEEAFAGSEPPAHWWRLYDDPVLDEAVEEALEANRDLRAAAANLARAQALLRETSGARLPATSLDGGVSSGENSAALGVPTAGVDNERTYDFGTDVSYRVDLFGRLRRAVEASRADSEAALAGYELGRVSVAAETARAYADACAFGLQIEVARDVVRLQQRSYEMTQGLLEAGRGTGLDVARAAAQLEQTRAAIPSLEAQRRGALFRLAVLMGRPPAEHPPEAAECVRPPMLDSVIPVGDGASLLRRRPDVREAERALAAASARVGVAVAELYPSVRFGASAGATALSSSELTDDEAFRWSIGPLLSWSFPNRVTARARVRGAEASADAALASFEGAWLEALRETESALSSYAGELDRVDALRRSRDRSAEAAELANARFEAGAVSFLDVLQAERALADAEAALARTRAQLSTDQISLFLALGGGWQ